MSSDHGSPVLEELAGRWRRFLSASAVRDFNVGAIILAPGFEVYRSELSEEYGWGRYPNVVTSLQFERLLSGLPGERRLIVFSDAPGLMFSW